MKDKEKYYTPEITEFHVGFEYEIFEDFDYLPKPIWHKFKWEGDCLNPERMEYPISSKVEKLRVKFLDQTDIEDCGFKHTGRAVCNWYKIEKRIADGFSTYGYWNIITLIHCEDNKVKIFAQEYETGDEHTLFQGEIKNKHELKKLMQQLNII